MEHKTPDELIGEIKSQNCEEGLKAAFALAVLHDEDATEPLIQTVGVGGDENWVVRSQACVALLIIGEKAIPDITKALTEDENYRVRAGMAEVLGMMRSSEGVGDLLNAVEDEHYKVRKYAVLAFRRIEQVDEAVTEKIRKLHAQETNQEVLKAIDAFNTKLGIS